MPRPTNTQFAVAVHVLTYLASYGEDRLVDAGEIARSANVNPVHVRRVLGPLRNAGIVASTPGAQGGWRLLADPAGTTLADVWRLVHGDEPVLGIHGPSPACPVGATIQRSLVEVDRAVVDAITARLSTTTIADLVTRARVHDDDLLEELGTT